MAFDGSAIQTLLDGAVARGALHGVAAMVVDRNGPLFHHAAGEADERTLFRNATFVIEVAASKPLTQVQQQFPALCKVGPNTKMSEIVQTHLPGIELVHMPTPPRQIRAISDHVYFYLDKSSPLWPEFSVASSIGLHFAGDWPGLQLDLWAIMEDRR